MEEGEGELKAMGPMGASNPINPANLPFEDKEKMMNLMKNLAVQKKLQEMMQSQGFKNRLAEGPGAALAPATAAKVKTEQPDALVEQKSRKMGQGLGARLGAGNSRGRGGRGGSVGGRA